MKSLFIPVAGIFIVLLAYGSMVQAADSAAPSHEPPARKHSHHPARRDNQCFICIVMV